MTSKYLTATAIAAILTLGAGIPALAQTPAGSDASSGQADCPEDMDTEPGCGLEGEASEPGPVEGAATAPVEPGAAPGAETTMEAPEGDPEDAASADTSSAGSDAGGASSGGDMPEGSAAAGEDCPEDMDTEPGCSLEGETSEPGPVEGAATAPVEPDAGSEGDATMESPDTEDPAEGAEDPATMDGEPEDASGGDEASAAPAEGDPNIVVAYEDAGRYYTADDVPTFNIGAAGEVDWLTYSGFRRYHSECHVCHGPDGEGSSYAPALKTSAVNMDYYDFYDVVVNGKREVNASQNQVMPAFGDNANVMCYLDDIYVYLKARGADAIPRGRPAEKAAKSDMIQEAEDACMGA